MQRDRFTGLLFGLKKIIKTRKIRGNGVMFLIYRRLLLAAGAIMFQSWLFCGVSFAESDADEARKKLFESILQVENNAQFYSHENTTTILVPVIKEKNETTKTKIAALLKNTDDTLLLNLTYSSIFSRFKAQLCEDLMSLSTYTYIGYITLPIDFAIRSPRRFFGETIRESRRPEDMSLISRTITPDDFDFKQYFLYDPYRLMHYLIIGWNLLGRSYARQIEIEHSLKQIKLKNKTHTLVILVREKEMNIFKAKFNENEILFSRSD
jgi:hypothetical protein